MTEQLKTNELLTMTANVVAAYVSNNTVTEGDLSKVIRGVYDTLASVGSPGETVKERPAPAVPIKKSVTPDYVICLEDGKKLKMLKRHLKTSYDLTPDDDAFIMFRSLALDTTDAELIYVHNWQESLAGR